VFKRDFYRVKGSYGEEVIHTQAKWSVMAGRNELFLNDWLFCCPKVFKR